jgi:hypothetical protein
VDMGIDPGLVTQFAGDSRTHSIEILERDHGRLVARNVYTQKTRHDELPKNIYTAAVKRGR